MDFSTLISPLISAAINLWYLWPILIGLAILRTPWGKGKIGEFQVNLILKLRLNKADYHLIKDITLPTADGSTQIDHILLSRFGIFVIETKNMRGWIFGKESQAMWTQQIYRYKSKFQNPIFQNLKHVRTLEGLLGLERGQAKSVIVFIGNATLKTKMPPHVGYAGNMIHYIKSFQTEVFTQAEINEFIELIESGRFARGFKTDREHVKHLREKHGVSTDKAESSVETLAQKQGEIELGVDERAPEKVVESVVPTCPKCSSVMVKRVAKRGVNSGAEFWGCSSFPKCRGVVRV